MTVTPSSLATLKFEQTGSVLLVRKDQFEKISQFAKNSAEFDELSHSKRRNIPTVTIPHGGSDEIKILLGQPTKKVPKDVFAVADYLMIEPKFVDEATIKILIEYFAAQSKDWVVPKQLPEQMSNFESIASKVTELKIEIGLDQQIPASARKWLFSRDLKNLKKLTLIGDVVVSFIELSNLKKLEELHVETEKHSPFRMISSTLPELRKLYLKCPVISTKGIFLPKTKIEKIHLVTKEPIVDLGYLEKMKEKLITEPYSS